MTNLKIDLNNYQDIKYLILMSLGSNKNKWWADDDFGSGLFLLNKSKIEKSTLAEVKRTIEDSLAWIIDDKLAKTINVKTTLNEKNRIDWQIEIIKPNNEHGNNETELIKGVWQYAES